MASGILPEVEPGFQPGGNSLETLEALENRALIRAARCRHGTRGFLIFQMRSWIAHDRPGNAVLEQGQTGEAIRQFQEVIRGKPDLASAKSNPVQAPGTERQIKCPAETAGCPAGAGGL